MNKKFAIEILEHVETNTLEKDSSLAKEAFRYLKRLKTTPIEVIERIYKIQYSK